VGAGRCKGLTRRGEPCQGTPTASGYCPAHTPALAQAVAEGRRRGGENKAISRRARKLLLASGLWDVFWGAMRVLDRLERGEMAPQEAVAAAQLLKVALEAVQAAGALAPRVGEAPGGPRGIVVRVVNPAPPSLYRPPGRKERIVGNKDRELARAVWLLKEAGLEEAAQLLARAWAAEGRPPGGRRRRAVRVWLPRARQWAALPADVVSPGGAAAAFGPAGGPSSAHGRSANIDRPGGVLA